MTMVNIRVARRVLNSFRQEKQSAILRVASRWLQANLQTKYDLMLRLQVLEGAAGVSVDSWWQRPNKATLKRARDAFEGTDINPVWFEERCGDMFPILNNSLKRIINMTRMSTIDPMDIIHNALAGLTIPFATNQRTDPQKILYGVGVYLASKIRRGRETPATVTKGVLFKTIAKKIIAASKNRELQAPYDSDYESSESLLYDAVGWSSSHKNSVSKYLTNVFFYDLKDPLGQEIRDYMKDVWSSARAKNRGIYMTYWLDSLENRKLLSQSELAAYFGIGKTTIYQMWPLAWKEFFKALWDNKPLLDKINRRLVSESLMPLQAKLPKDFIERLRPPK